jgi:hypothetical protein
MSNVKEFLDSFNVNILDHNIIKIFVDKKTNMACIEVNSEFIMEGNFWDFHNSCHGGSFYLLEDFYSYKSLANKIKNYFIKNNLNVEVITEDY